MAGPNVSRYWILVRTEAFFRIRGQNIDFSDELFKCVHMQNVLFMYHTTVMWMQNQKGIIYSFINTNIPSKKSTVKLICCEAILGFILETNETKSWFFWTLWQANLQWIQTCCQILACKFNDQCWSRNNLSVL